MYKPGRRHPSPVSLIHAAKNTTTSSRRQLTLSTTSYIHGGSKKLGS